MNWILSAVSRLTLRSLPEASESVMGNGLCATQAVEPTEEVLINLEHAFTPNSAKVETVGTGEPTRPTVPGLPPGDWDGKPLFEHIPETMSEEEDSAFCSTWC